MYENIGPRPLKVTDKMSLLEYLPLALNLAFEMYSAWRTGPERPRTRVLGWLRRGSPPVGTAAEASEVTTEILRNLPPGASAYYQAPDGTRLLVWRAAPQPEPCGEGDGYQLW